MTALRLVSDVVALVRKGGGLSRPLLRLQRTLIAIPNQNPLTKSVPGGQSSLLKSTSRRSFPMKKILLFLVAALLVASTAFAGKKYVISVTQIVEHPALDAMRNGVADRLKEKGIDFDYNVHIAQGNMATNTPDRQPDHRRAARCGPGHRHPRCPGLRPEDPRYAHRLHRRDRPRHRRTGQGSREHRRQEHHRHVRLQPHGPSRGP